MILNFLVSKSAYLSHFMEILRKYVGYIVIWWLFLNSRSQKKNGVEEYREVAAETAILFFIDVLTDVPSSELCAGHLSPIKTI